MAVTLHKVEGHALNWETQKVPTYSEKNEKEKDKNAKNVPT